MVYSVLTLTACHLLPSLLLLELEVLFLRFVVGKVVVVLGKVILREAVQFLATISHLLVATLVGASAENIVILFDISWFGLDYLALLLLLLLIHNLKQLLESGVR